MVAALLVIAWAWLRLEQPIAPLWRPVVLLVLALGAAAPQRRRLRLLAAVVATLLAARIVFGVDLLPWRADGLSTVGTRFGNGFSDFYSTHLPFDPRLHPAMGELVLAALFGFSLVAALLAAAALLPKTRDYGGVIATAAVIAVLTAIAQVVSKPTGFSVGWGLWLLLAFTLLQAIVAVAALLLEAGVISAPTPRPRYEQFGQYGPPPGGYYGQPGPQGPPQGLQPRPNYPAQYGGGYSSSPSTGGFGGAQSGPPTPPTGFPSFSPPPSTGSGQQQPAAQPEQQQPQAPSSSPSSGPNPS
jgi:hypothetical protein